MSELHAICKFPTRPINKSYIEQLKGFLEQGIPSTYTVEECDSYIHEEQNKKEGEVFEPLSFPEDQNTTPLHLITRFVPKDIDKDEEAVVWEMIDELFNWGAGWNLTDYENKTPGDLLFDRGFRGGKLYDRIVDAGVTAEILLRKINDGDLEFLSDSEEHMYEEHEKDEEVIEGKDPVPEDQTVGELEKEESLKEEQIPDSKEEKLNQIAQELINDPANTQSTYLQTKLEYKDGALITKDNLDGVMMDWEFDLMKAGRDSIFRSVDELTAKRQSGVDDDNLEDIQEVNILNIGFGMGIIDTLIQERNPTNHYICEAHPDVLQKLRDDGWYAKRNVFILEGRWQETLPELLNKGVFFNGIYYDTYSEHYSDMLDLFDLIVGLLKSSGVFSFFNGLGADRQVVYDVYKKIVEIDLNNYGMNVEYKQLETPKSTSEKNDHLEDSVWNGIKRAYWRCETYNHPEIRFA